ncbi:GNAT family N-acetyltransferase [Bifidobacterium jacchi]|uniref:GNAT family N-acetyltransferase n=1 Tax=Bifidobacterium jacchi TaxID=2490545 RepID=UPI001F4F53DA|nr:GNAT family N-acetyltransferase [Bifidobacterium jacchi]
MSETIETARLLLRPWKVDDMAEAVPLFRYASDPEIGPLCGWPPHASVESSLNDIRNILAVENNWAITIKENGDEPVGSIALKPVSHYTIDPVEADDALRERYGRYLGGNALELGYWIGRPFWGRGFMTEALNAVLGYAFDTLHKDAVWGGHYRENDRSGRVMANAAWNRSLNQRTITSALLTYIMTASSASSPLGNILKIEHSNTAGG